MRIGIVETGLPPVKTGGAEVQAWALARRLALAHQVTVFTKRYTGLPAEETVEDVRIIRTRVFPSPVSLPFHILFSARTILKERDRLDVLLCFRATPGGVIGAFVKKRTGLPFCVSIRGGDWYFVAPHAWGRALLKFVFANTDQVVVQAPGIKKDIQATFADVSPAVIPNGVTADTREAQGDAVLFVGNLIPRKGVDVLLKAMRALPDIPVVIAGDGPERNRLEALSAGMKVTFLGRVKPEHVRDIMVEHGRVLVLPAVKGEGFPNVINEAMSVGLPVIASALAGIPDMLASGTAGCLVQPGSVEELRDAVCALYDDPQKRTAFSVAGKQAAGRYEWSLVAERWIETLSAIQGKREQE